MKPRWLILHHGYHCYLSLGTFCCTPWDLSCNTPQKQQSGLILKMNHLSRWWQNHLYFVRSQWAKLFCFTWRNFSFLYFDWWKAPCHANCTKAWLDWCLFALNINAYEKQAYPIENSEFQKKTKKNSIFPIHRELEFSIKNHMENDLLWEETRWL